MPEATTARTRRRLRVSAVLEREQLRGVGRTACETNHVVDVVGETASQQQCLWAEDPVQAPAKGRQGEPADGHSEAHQGSPALKLSRRGQHCGSTAPAAGRRQDRGSTAPAADRRQDQSSTAPAARHSGEEDRGSTAPAEGQSKENGFLPSIAVVIFAVPAVPQCKTVYPVISLNLTCATFQNVLIGTQEGTLCICHKSRSGCFCIY